MPAPRLRTSLTRMTSLLATLCVVATAGAGSASAAGWYGSAEVGLPHGINAWDGPRALIPDPAGDGYWVRDGYTAVARLAHVGASGVTDRIVPTPTTIQTSNILVDTDGTILTSDPTSTTITRFDADGTILQQFGTAGTGPAQLQRPWAMALALDGSYYVADVTNDTIVQYERDGTVRRTFGSTGTGNGQFRDVYGMAVAPNGDLYTVDSSNRRVTRFSATGVYISRWGVLGTGPGQFTGPRAISIDPSTSDVIVADTGNQRVQRFTSTGTFLNYIADSTSAHHVVRPLAVFAANGEARVMDIATNQVHVYTSAGALLGAEGDAMDDGGAFRYVRDIAVAPDGSYAVSDYFDHRIQRFSASGQFLNTFGSYGSGPGRMDTPRGVAFLPDGDVLIADSGNSRFVRFRADGTYVSSFGTNGTGPGQYMTPGNLALAPSGEVILSDSSGNKIERVQQDGTWLQTIATVGSGPGQVSGPRGVAVAPDGTIFVCDSGNHRIAKFAADGTFVANFGSQGSGSGQLDTPYRVDVLRDGNLVVADTMNNRLQIFTQDGDFVEAISGSSDGSLVPTFSQPNAAVAAPDGSLLASDRAGHRIVRLRPDAQAPGVVASLTPSLGGARLTASAGTDSGVGIDAQSSVSLDGGATWTGAVDEWIPAAAWSTIERTVLVRDRVGNVSAPTTVSARVADVLPPTISLPRAVRGSTPLNIRTSLTFGSADDASGIAAVSATFRGTPLRVANGTIAFAGVREGRGVLVLRATDLAGNVEEVRATVIVDRTAPQLHAFATHVMGSDAKLQWRDAVSGVGSSTRALRNLKFGANRVTLTATDRSGNTAKLQRTIYRHPSLARPELNAGASDAFTERGHVNGALRFIGYAPPWYASTDASPEIVGEVQVRLRLFGFLRGYARAGALDIPTIRAIQNYQRARNLPVLGTVGPRTRAMLDRDLLRAVSA